MYNVVTYANFGDDQLRGLWMEGLGGSNFPLLYRFSVADYDISGLRQR